MSPDASEPLEVIQVPLKPGEAVCARCGRVWRPSVKNPRWGIGPVHGFPAGFCLSCVREIEREVVLALQTEPNV